MPCNVCPHLECEDCPFVSCNNNPRFFLALQCAACRGKARGAGGPHARKRPAG